MIPFCQSDDTPPVFSTCEDESSSPVPLYAKIDYSPPDASDPNDGGTPFVTYVSSAPWGSLITESTRIEWIARTENPTTLQGREGECANTYTIKGKFRVRNRTLELYNIHHLKPCRNYNLGLYIRDTIFKRSHPNSTKHEKTPSDCQFITRKECFDSSKNCNH